MIDLGHRVHPGIEGSSKHADRVHVAAGRNHHAAVAAREPIRRRRYGTNGRGHTPHQNEGDRRQQRED